MSSVFNISEVLSSASEKANLFTEAFSEKSHLDDLVDSLTAELPRWLRKS